MCARALTIYNFIEGWSNHTPDSIAIEAPDRPPLTYKKLHDHVLETINSLYEMGISRNDRVAVILPNGPEMAVTFLAVASGATCAPLNPRYRERELDFFSFRFEY